MPSVTLVGVSTVDPKTWGSLGSPLPVEGVAEATHRPLFGFRTSDFRCSFLFSLSLSVTVCSPDTPGNATIGDKGKVKIEVQSEIGNPKSETLPVALYRQAQGGR